MFEEYKDNARSIYLTSLLVFLILAFSIFLNLSGEISGNIYNYLIISSVLILIISFLEFNNTNFIEANFFGLSKQKIYASLFAGISIGFLISALSANSLVLPVQSILEKSDINYFLVNIVAPIIEPLFWRGIVAVSLITFFTKTTKNKILGFGIGLILSSYLFGFYHINTYLSQSGFSVDESISMIFFASFFAILWFVGNNIFQCVAFEIGWHFINNLIAVGFTTEQIIYNSILFVIGFVILVELTYRD